MGTVVFTRGGELERDGVNASALVTGGLLVCSSSPSAGRRVALIENRDGSPRRSGLAGARVVRIPAARALHSTRWRRWRCRARQG